MVVTLDTTQLLRSALNALALTKAVVFVRGERRSVRCEIDQIKQQGPQLSTIGNSRRTVIHGRHTRHDPFADVGVEQGSTLKGCCV